MDRGEDKENWDKYSKMSADEEASRKAFIQEQEGVTMSATAQLNANKQQVQTLTAQISDLASEIISTQAGLAELQKLRKEEHKAHEEEVADLSKTIGAINKAVEVHAALIVFVFRLAHGRTIAVAINRLQFRIKSLESSNISVKF